METSPEINEIATALHKAQGHMGAAKKDSVNPFFKSKYSDLSSVMQAISLPFYDNGLSFTQAAEAKDGIVSVTTRIMHISGQWIQSITDLPTAKRDAQAYGSALTYAKRYGLQALCGVPSDDDDGQSATAAVRKEKEAQEKLLFTENNELLDVYKKSLESSSSIDELVKYWREIPKQHHKQLSLIKDEMKSKLTEDKTEVDYEEYNSGGHAND